MFASWSQRGCKERAFDHAGVTSGGDNGCTHLRIPKIGRPVQLLGLEIPAHKHPSHVVNTDENAGADEGRKRAVVTIGIGPPIVHAFSCIAASPRPGEDDDEREERHIHPNFEGDWGTFRRDCRILFIPHVQHVVRPHVQVSRHLMRCGVDMYHDV